MYDSLLKYILGIIFVVLALLTSSISSQANDDSILKDRQFQAWLENGATGVSIPDTIYAELMTPDSVVVANMYIAPNTVTMESMGEITDTKTIMMLQFRAAGDDFILRLSHPDYAVALFEARSKGARTDLGTIKMRRLTSFERSRMLGEVTVTASVIQVVNKGDTIQYNADAFAVAKGSMLDALIEKMPGVELRESGRIYVNGRFVDKLLLDGKDFFKGDQFVLLQNLPTYTVKNLKVYEQASASHEVFGRKSSTDPDLYVMDITLKKGYNSGFLANAEAGGGSHNRYRGRAFGSIYNTVFRLGVYGYINNLNETRNPGRDGSWKPSDSNAGLTTAKGAGISYGVSRPGRTLEFTGTTSAQYSKTWRNSLINRQNFLSGSDTYTRRWTDNLIRDISLNTTNELVLRPAEGNRYNQTFSLNADYREGREKGNTTEATFDTRTGAESGLRNSLEHGWVDGMNLLNRYLTASEANTRSYSANLTSFTNIRGSNNNGLSLIGAASYDRTDSRNPNYDNYLVQYAGSSPTTRFRSNPQSSYTYAYNLAVAWFRPLGAYFNLRPRIDFYWTYRHTDNPWLIKVDSLHTPAGEMLPSVRADILMMTDPKNSYVAGEHSYNIRPWISFGYDRTSYRDGLPYQNINAAINFKANIRRGSINFHGQTAAKAVRNYVTPSLTVATSLNLYRMLHFIRVAYSIEGTGLDMFDMINNVVFDYDPLNLRTGNDELRQSTEHMVDVHYSNSNWMFDRLKMYVNLSYNLLHNQKAISYAYDRASGVRTYYPVNVNGNRFGEFVIGPTVALTRDKNLKLVDYLKFVPKRSVDMMSYDDFASTQKSIVNSFYISEYWSLEYNVKKFMAAFDGQIETRRTTSADGYFSPFRVTTYRYGVRGRVTLPAGFEINTDLKMYSNRGFDYHEMNTDQLVWNARITKTLLDGRLMLFLDGYDILGRVKNISYQVNEQGRTETWVNNIPSYAMLSLRWNFAKKPRE